MADGLGTRMRCLAVALGLTAAGWGAVAVLAKALAEPADDAAGAVVRLCLAALTAAAAWGWVTGAVTVVEAWRGSEWSHRRGVPSAPRRLILLACGVALTGALAAPAANADARPHPGSLSGLPLPDRAEGPAHARAPVHAPASAPATRARSVLVRPGDSLWSLAAADLPPGASAPAVAARSRLIYRLNHDVVGPDPDLIRPGQLLRLPRNHR